MRLTDEDILKFQVIWKNKFGTEINKEDAYEKGVQLLRLVSAIYRPMTETEYQQLQLRRKETGEL
jgi:hypothetical protein